MSRLAAAQEETSQPQRAFDSLVDSKNASYTARSGPNPSSFILFLSQEDVCELLLRHRQFLAGSHGLAEVDSQDVFALQS